MPHTWPPWSQSSGPHLPQPQRNLTHHHTLLDHEQDVKDLLPDVVDSKAYKSAIKSIHTSTVANTLQSYNNNRVLQHPPPKVNPEETKLSRKERSTLSQLRSGFSKMLNSYLNRINGTPDVCPSCAESPHDTAHLFDCRENPTTLTVINLWTSPIEVANFLKLNEPD